MTTTSSSVDSIISLSFFDSIVVAILTLDNDHEREGFLFTPLIADNYSLDI